MSQKKNKKTFFCKKCDYITCNKYDWNKHILTRKHKMITNDKNDNKNVDFICKFCNKKYKFNSGLSRHLKKCHNSNNGNVEKKSQKSQKSPNGNQSEKVKDLNFKTIMMEFMKTQSEQIKQQKQTIELLQQSIDTNTKMMPKIGNNNNNKISINLFLNEKCKDAMNLKDFIQNITISLDDLMYTQQHGYVKGIENIFTKKLQIMKPTERPIHCSDKKRMQFYIKDEDTWAKDENHEKIDRTIHDIKIKQIKSLAIWEKENPNYMKDEKLLHQWQTLIHEIMGDPEVPDVNKKHIDNIKKNLATEMSMKQAIKEIKNID